MNTTPRKTTPTRQYDIFWVPTGTPIPDHSVAVTPQEHDPAGQWAMKFGGPGFLTESHEGINCAATIPRAERK